MKKESKIHLLTQLQILSWTAYCNSILFEVMNNKSMDTLEYSTAFANLSHLSRAVPLLDRHDFPLIVTKKCFNCLDEFFSGIRLFEAGDAVSALCFDVDLALAENEGSYRLSRCNLAQSIIELKTFHIWIA